MVTTTLSRYRRVVLLMLDYFHYSEHLSVSVRYCQVQNTVARQRTSVSFKLAVRGDSGAGGLVAPLPCTAYFGKLANLFGCSLPQQA